MCTQSKQSSRSYAFPSMNREQRRAVHELAEAYGCETQSYDYEPNKNVVATAHRQVIFFSIISGTFSSSFLVCLCIEKDNQINAWILVCIVYMFTCMSKFFAFLSGVIQVISVWLFQCVIRQVSMWCYTGYFNIYFSEDSKGRWCDMCILICRTLCPKYSQEHIFLYFICK